VAFGKGETVDNVIGATLAPPLNDCMVGVCALEFSKG